MFNTLHHPGWNKLVSHNDDKEFLKNIANKNGLLVTAYNLSSCIIWIELQMAHTGQ